MPVQSRPIVPLRFKLARRFYEVLILYQCLRLVHKNSGLTVPSLEIASDATQPDRHALNQFVDKLGHVCDSNKGGNTVTAFTILQLDEGIEYVFASNMRTAEEIEQCKQYMQDLLDCLGAMSPDRVPKEKIVSTILHKVLVFVKKRVLWYVKTIRKQADACIASCNVVPEASNADMQTKEAIEQLVSLAKVVMSAPCKEDAAAFSAASEALIREIQGIQKGPLHGFASRSRHGNSCWDELRHANGRLLSYLYAIDIMIRARKTWPQLFQDFKIHGLPSGTPIDPFANSHGKITGDAIIGRMSSDRAVIEARRREVAALQVHRLDERIQEWVDKPTFRPIVHAEVKVSDWLVRNNYTHPSHFFQGEKYIGCSKPTCKLCEYYFQVSPHGFKVRPGHGNFYVHWRTPDVFSGEEKGRERIMNDMLALIRTETFRAITDNFSVRKTHDSNTYPTKDMYQTVDDESVLGEFDVSSEVDAAEFESSAQDSPLLSIGSEEGMFTQITQLPNLGEDGKGILNDEYDDDDEDGGVRI